ncbi:MAG: nickel pincer cofactor biosynthesis protein LarB [Methanobacteriota archaeon]|nr:MAG: nickel pincer cofactor biosynthesis protein LarB [Euryarchaeota archaeon]
MNIEELQMLLQMVQKGECTIEEASETILKMQIEALEFANLDYQRSLRQGFPEVIFCEGKTTQQVLEIAQKIHQHHGLLLATRASVELYESLKKTIPGLHFDAAARCIFSEPPESDPQLQGLCAVVTAGTTDYPVAKEAEITLRMFGVQPALVVDVGAAGLHRLNHHWEKLRKAAVVIVIAGMEGALPTIIAGLIDKPVIAVPTSVGYGVNFSGLTPLLAMLNSCANSVTVVNINNGYGAAFSAALYLKQLKRFLQENENSNG